MSLRKEFEEWRRRTAKMDPDEAVALDGFGDNYAHRTTQAMWLAWRASRRLHNPAPQQPAVSSDTARLDWLEAQDLNDLATVRQTNGVIGLNVGHGPRYGKTLRKAIDAAMGTPRQAEPVALQAGQGEPVAYRYKDTRGNWRYVGAPLTKGWGFPENLHHEPLYAAPGEPTKMREAVTWQKRHPESTEGQWETCSYADYIFWDKRPGWETRALYASPTHERAAPAPEPMKREIERLRNLAGTCYAGLGAECNLPELWLNALAAAANGQYFDTEGLLPFTASPSQPVAAEGAPRSCRMEDGRCGICGGDWSVCGCEGMLRKGAGGADQG